jgi:hypothetical protein
MYVFLIRRLQLYAIRHGKRRLLIWTNERMARIVERQLTRDAQL